jgi:hypothetical protein
MSFFNLPSDLILEVADHMKDSEVNLLARSCRSLNRLLNPYLYTRDVKSGHPEALRWAIEEVEVATAKLSLNACSDIEKIVCRSSCSLALTWASPVTVALERWQYREPKDVEAHMSLIRLLLERGVKMCYLDTQDLLTIAGARGLLELVHLVFHYGSHLKLKAEDISDSVITQALSGGLPGVIRLLLSYGVHPGRFSLHSIASNGHIAAARLLLEHGVDVNETDESGFTPLHTMLYRSRLCGNVLEMVRLLIKNGAEVERNPDWTSWPLLLCALMRADTSLASYLVESGADIHWKTRSGCTLLHLAVTCRPCNNFGYVIRKLG